MSVLTPDKLSTDQVLRLSGRSLDIAVATYCMRAKVRTAIDYLRDFEVLIPGTRNWDRLPCFHRSADAARLVALEMYDRYKDGYWVALQAAFEDEPFPPIRLALAEPAVFAKAAVLISVCHQEGIDVPI